MSNITPSPVLAHVVSIIKDAVSDIKTEYLTTTTAILRDGNDSIYLDEQLDNSSNNATIIIRDPRDIIFSEDLLPILSDLSKDTASRSKPVIIVVNELEVGTYLILETAKDAFDQLSNSYELIKTIERDQTKLKSAFKFGKHAFNVIINNDVDQITVAADFDSTLDPAIKKVIEADTLKVQNALQAIYKG